MIGQHTVILTPDPTTLAWGPVLNTNPYMTSDLTGWRQLPFSQPWAWAAGGYAVPTDLTKGAQLGYDDRLPGILRGASTMFRLRIRFSVTAPCQITAGLYYGDTATAAYSGPFWNGYDHSTMAETQMQCPVPGSYLFEYTHATDSVPAGFIYVAPHIWTDANTGPKIDSIELSGQGAVATDISCLVDEVTIHHGRADTDSQPEASSCTLDISLDSGATEFPSALDVGGIIRVTTDTPQTSSVRFVGRITDLAQGWAEAGADTPEQVVAQVIATGSLADLGRRTVGAVPWGQELDGARISRIMAAAGITLDPTTSDPGTVQILPRDVDSQPALELAQAVAADASGVVWATKGGDIRYADADHRRGAVAALELDACDILVTPTWRRTTEGLINDVSIGYGVPPEGQDQPRYTAERTDSKAKYGTYGLSATTQLVSLADATAMGQLLLTRNLEPVWVMGDLPVDVAGLDAARTVTLLSLDLHTLIRLTGLPAAGQLPTTASLWVEGWTEKLAWGTHTLELVVSGYCRTSPAPRWDDLDPSRTWDSQGSTTWDQASCLGPQPNLGRWDDVPATQRWDTTHPGVTWDNYAPAR